MQSAGPIRVVDLLALLVVTASGAWLRLYGLGWPSLWLDEILNVDITRRSGALPLWRWIAGFEPENGPLYFALHALALHAPGGIEAQWRLPAAIVGIATIPLVFLAARLVARSTGAALCATILLCVSPFHVFYSREGRTYALLLLETIVVVIALAMPAGKRSNLLLTLAVVAAAYTAATAAPLIASVMLVGVMRLIRDRDRNAAKIVAASMVGLILLAVLYLGHPRTPSQAVFTSDAARIARDTLVMFSSTTQPVRSLPRISMALAILGLIGAMVLGRRERRALDVLVFLPLSIIGSTIAALVITDHWFSVRYLTPLFGVFLLNAAAGLWIAATFFGRMLGRSLRGRAVATPFVAALALLAIGEDQAVLALREPYERPDWRGTAAVIKQHSRSGDTVLAANPWAYVSLDFYLRELEVPVKIHLLSENVAAAEDALKSGTASWMVAGGVYDSEEIRWWLCRRLHLAFADESDELRLYYAPGELELLRSRLSVQEFAEYRTSLRGSIDLSSGSSYLKDGWYLPEHLKGALFRWAGARATFLVPASTSDAYLTFRGMPEGNEQRLTVTVNGVALDEPVVMTRGWNDYHVPLPPSDRRVDEVTFIFSNTAVPARSGSRDRRALAAAFEAICVVTDKATPCRSGTGPLPARLSTGIPRRPPLWFWRDGDGEADRGEIRALLSRLGMAPSAADAVVSKQEDLQRLVRLGMLSRECADERQFIDDTFTRIYQRWPSEESSADARRSIARDGRKAWLDALMRTREFRRRYFETEGERNEASLQR